MTALEQFDQLLKEVAELDGSPIQPDEEGIIIQIYRILLNFNKRIKTLESK